MFDLIWAGALYTIGFFLGVGVIGLGFLGAFVIIAVVGEFIRKA